jgi:hypothetical protein
MEIAGLVMVIVMAGLAAAAAAGLVKVIVGRLSILQSEQACC